MIKIQKLYRIIKFGTVGLSGVIVNSGILSFLTEIVRIDYRFSAITAIEISILNNFLWNSIWTWRDHRVSSSKSLLHRLFKFHLSCIFTAFLINYGFLILLTELFNVPYVISNLIGIAVGSVVNYLTSHFWVFQHKKHNIIESTRNLKKDGQKENERVAEF